MTVIISVQVTLALIFIIILIYFYINPSGGIGRHNKLKICRLIAIKVQVLFRILLLFLRNNSNILNMIREFIGLNIIDRVVKHDSFEYNYLYLN
jgi:hypothetical protein